MNMHLTGSKVASIIAVALAAAFPVAKAADAYPCKF